VTNGVILCQGRPKGYARTLQTYRDYRLHVEWRFPSGPGNSGIFLHITGADRVWPACLEAQLLSGDAGEIRCNGGSKVNGTTAEHPNFIPRRQPSSEKPLGEWNSYDIICRSNTVTVRVNGVLQNEVTGASVSSGAIGLQVEGKPAEFRNLMIEPLPSVGLQEIAR
jgi:3-keto-disaccharide hydrolase